MKILKIAFVFLLFGCGKTSKQRAIDTVLDYTYNNRPYNAMIKGYWHDIEVDEDGEITGMKLCYRHCYYDISTGDTFARYDKLYVFDAEGNLVYSRDF